MGTALGGGDDVDEGTHLVVVSGAPPRRDVDLEAAFHVGGGHHPGLVEHRHGLGERITAGQPQHLRQRGVLRQEIHELRDASLVEEHLCFAFSPAGIGHLQAQTRDEEGGLARPVVELGQGETGVGEEDLFIAPVAHPGSRAVLRHPPKFPQT